MASGLGWDGLQLAAWANMAWRNAATMDGATALRQAVAGAPCKHCLSIREARKQADAGAPVADASKRIASDLVPPGHPFPSLMRPKTAFARPADLVAERRTREVDVPPPRAEVA